MSPRLLLLVGAALAAGAQTFPVSGTVVDAVTNQPMKRVRMALAPSDRRSAQMDMFTGEDGTFLFTVPQGKFALTAERNGVRQAFGLSAAGVGFGSLIITGADQDTSHLTFRWFAPGAIFGKVIDDRGEPAEAVLVQLIRASIFNGHKRTATFGWAYTDDGGNYRFGALVAGTYYLAVTGQPWYNRLDNALLRLSLPGAPGVVNTPTGPAAAYAPVYYPHASDARGAAPLVLGPGGEARADFTLLPTTGVTVRVNCECGEVRAGLIGLTADGIAGVEAFQSQQSFFGQPMSFTGVPPGRYVVRLTATGDHPMAIRKSIEVGGSDVAVYLVPLPAPLLTGKVTFKNPAVQPRGNLYFRLMNVATDIGVNRSIERDGTFSWPVAPVGEFRPLIAGTDGFFADQVSVEGATFKDGVIDIVEGASVRVNMVATDESGRLKGFVMNGDKPAPGVLAVVAPRSLPSDTYRYRSFQTDSDGSFDFQNVHAGDYVLFAVDRLDLEYTNPEIVRPYLALGTPIRVDPHDVQVQRVPLTPQIRSAP